MTKQEKNFGKTWNFSYSSENQLVAIDIVDGSTTTNIDYTYDALGRRTSKSVVKNGQTEIRKYVYDNQEIIAELDGGNNTLVKYTHSGMRTDDVLAMDVTSMGVAAGFAPSVGTYHFLKDGLGSVIDITNSAGSIVQHYVYSSFGKLLKIENGSTDNTTNPNIKTPYSYTNREYDQESGLYYYRARYYDAHSGRFLQEDAHPGKQMFPQSITNRYIYVNNNSIMRVDPKGEFWNIVFPTLVGAIVGSLISASNGGDILQGAKYGALTGFSVGVGMLGAALLMGEGTGLVFALQEMAVSGFLSGLTNGALLEIVDKNPKSFNKGFTQGFIGGAAGTAIGKIGLPSGTNEGIEIGIDSPDVDTQPDPLDSIKIKIPELM